MKHFHIIFFFFIILILIYFTCDEQKCIPTIIKILEKDANITVNGKKDYDIQVLDDKFYYMVMKDKEYGIAQSYVLGYWTSKSLFKTLLILMENQEELKKHLNYTFFEFFFIIKSSIMYDNEIIQSLEKINDFSISTELYEKTLDKNMNYSVGLFSDTNDLEMAQMKKMQLIGNKLHLKKDETVLVLDCEHGGLVNYLAKTYNVYVVGITSSYEKLRYSEEKYRENKNVSFQLLQYYNIPQKMKFDKIVVINQLENIHTDEHSPFFRVLSNALKENGMILVECVGSYVNQKITGKRFSKNYKFSSKTIPMYTDLSYTLSNFFQIQDWSNLGKHYSKTYQEWHKNVNTNWNKLNYGPIVQNLWNFYLLGTAASFEKCELHAWQILLTKNCPSTTLKQHCVQ